MTESPRADRKGVTLWFTGLPCSGKSAVADRVAEILGPRKRKAAPVAAN